jgi:23S rRNA (cytidine1920-2'-O)/16S rRNA (cytidine1409-2'-O)-methyltransferase
VGSLLLRRERAGGINRPGLADHGKRTLKEGKQFKERIDKLLFEKRLVESRERARALILEGKVSVDGEVIHKPGENVLVTSEVQIRGDDLSYVSRGGKKLERALDVFGIDPAGMVVMDVGASSGGFTDCLLQRGAGKVYAIDVGYGQLAWKLRNDPRVISRERTNIRYLKREEISEEVDLIVIDTSFISVEKFLPHLALFLKKGGEIVSLIKPQFEVGRGEVGKGGVVRDPGLHQKVIDRISIFCKGIGFAVLGVTESPILGPKGNKEFFIRLRASHQDS